MRNYPSDRVDLRSDTVTQPTPSMRDAMANASVGDDVLGDDNTVIELQNRVAKMFGKQAGLFVPSGTMCNAVAIRAQTEPGDEIISERYSHIYVYEGGGYAALSGVSISLVDGSMGIMDPADVENSIRKGDGSLGHYPNGSLVCIENSTNRGGGTCYPIEIIDSIASIAKKNGCKSHIDGARIFNSSIATGLDVSRISENFDSVSICLSKGLGAPIGSVLVGSNKMINKAFRWRKMFGGGMRQVGVIAAAGLFALDNNIERLSKDHERAFMLGEAIDSMTKYSVDLNQIQTNMVYVKCISDKSSELIEKLSELGIDALSIDENSIRLVTHLHITNEDIERTISAFEMSQ